MRRTATAVLAAVLAAAPALAKDTRFWNLTANTITSFQLAPAGTGRFGESQTRNDTDGTVDHDERLRITGIATGLYDARFTDDKGRTCVVRNLAIRQGAIFDIEEKKLTDCRK